MRSNHLSYEPYSVRTRPKLKHQKNDAKYRNVKRPILKYRLRYPMLFPGKAMWTAESNAVIQLPA